MTTKPDDNNIQSVEVKDQFGSKHQKYFKTMIIDQEKQEGGLFFQKFPMENKTKENQANDSVLEPNSAVVKPYDEEQDGDFG